MPALSFQEEWLDKLLSGDKQQTTRPQTNRFKVGDVGYIYNQQRRLIVDKPLRPLTATGLQLLRQGYPFLKSDEYKAGHHAHFLGKVEIMEVHDIRPCRMTGEELEAWAWADGFDGYHRIDPFGDPIKVHADEWFTKHYGDDWMHKTWTVIQWHGWMVRYFEPGMI